MEILSLGEKIKRRRKELNMTLKDLAGDRITPGQISLVESGKSNPSMDLLEYLAKELDTSIEYLMESEETQAEKNCDYFENIAESYIIGNDLVQAEHYIERALYYAETYKLEYKKANNLYLRGKIYMLKGEYPMAQQFFLSANIIFIRNNEYEKIIKTFIYLGRLNINLKSYHSASGYFKQAEKVYKENSVGNDFLIGQIYYYMSSIYFKLEEIEKAMNYSYLAKEKFRQMDDDREYAKTLMLLAEEYNRRGNLDNAIKYSQKALDIYNKINDTAQIANIENNLGKLFYEFDNVEESFIHLRKSKELRIQISDPKIMETFKNICENYIKLKDIENSRKVLEEMLSNMKDGNDKSMVEYYLLKYRVDLLERNEKEGENTLIMALKFAKSMGIDDKIGEISILLGKFYMDAGNEEKAAKYLNQAVDMFKSMGIIKNS